MARNFLASWFFLGMIMQGVNQSTADDLRLDLKYQTETEANSGKWVVRSREEIWKPSETAIIVCDVWDVHHSINAVRRLEQFAPRLNEVLTAARNAGVTIIHSPSDCMEAYIDHPSRNRAIQTPAAPSIPYDQTAWCSAIPGEERAVYPIDQSDGGEDDDPVEHKTWEQELRAMGRDPATPWKEQNKQIEIDESRDYVSDRGDEVFNILEHRGITRVILTGVHLNMCVLGRPFGIRQMLRAGKHVVLMHDMTDTMYNPRSWPYVSHEEGTELVISHVERFLCPTITSDQIIGGNPFRLRSLTSHSDVQPNKRRWKPISIPSRLEFAPDKNSTYLRSVVKIPKSWLLSDLRLELDTDLSIGAAAWLNGQELVSTRHSLAIPHAEVAADDFNLLVIRLDSGVRLLRTAPKILAGENQLDLEGRWQTMSEDEHAAVNLPLPAKFGGAADMVFVPDDPLYVVRPATRIGEFTSGIEGPACDNNGELFAVNYERQGTIGRLTLDGAVEVFVDLPEGSIGNGIRLDKAGNFYVADYTNHNVLKVDPVSKNVTVHAHNNAMNQPNDLASMSDGTLFASDPNWSNGTGQVWRIDTNGETTLVAESMGTTNGIEVSPDESTLYVNESKQLNIWAFDITDEKRLVNKRLLRKFTDFGFDGMRCDVQGNLYVTRYGKGTVAVLSPSGDLMREINLPGSKPSNICFGGSDGRTAFVTEVEFQRILTFRVEHPGYAWSRLSQ